MKTPSHRNPHCLAVATLLLAVAAFPLMSLPTHAATWNEVGDAGDTPGTSQVTVGAGPLTTISGTLPIDADIDMYRIAITDRTIFQAAITGQTGFADPDLWLFDAAGFGIALTTNVAAGQTLITGAFVPSNGDYFLAISSSGVNAISAGGNIWLSNPGAAQRAPDGPGAAQPFLSWGAGSPLTKTSYTIQLQGAGFSQAPEPSAAVNLIFAGGMLLLRRKRPSAL